MESHSHSGQAAAHPEETLYGKLIGVVEDRAQFENLRIALSRMGWNEIEALEGPSGIRQLEAALETVSQYFMGDMESDAVHRYLEAVRQGLIVFLAHAIPETIDAAANTAIRLGAGDVVHFGNSVITNY